MIRSLLPFLFILPSLVYSLLALVAARSFFARKPVAGRGKPPVSILKPLKGCDNSLFGNLETFCSQDYPEFQVVFTLRSPLDPAIPVLERLKAAYPRVDMTIVVDGTCHGTNGKIGNIINAFSFLKHDLIVIADSDIKVPTDYLSRLADRFADPAVGMVTSLYRGSGVRSLPAVMEALGFCGEMVPNVIVAEKLEGLTFALGASMAVRRRALEDIGGFEVLADYLADDYQLGNKIHRAGWQVVLSGDFVDIAMERESLASVFSRQLRWCRTMRVSRPGGYLASGITQPIPGLVLAAVVAGLSLPTIVAAALLYGVRSAILTFFSCRHLHDGLLPRFLWLLPCRDLLTTVTWLLAFTGNRVSWRGEFFKVNAGGKMVRME